MKTIFYIPEGYSFEKVDRMVRRTLEDEALLLDVLCNTLGSDPEVPYQSLTQLIRDAVTPSGAIVLELEFADVDVEAFHTVIKRFGEAGITCLGYEDIMDLETQEEGVLGADIVRVVLFDPDQEISRYAECRKYHDGAINFHITIGPDDAPEVVERSLYLQSVTQSVAASFTARMEMRP